MKSLLKFALVFYLLVLLVLAVLPLTGYYAAAGALPVIGFYLYRRLGSARSANDGIISRGTFLLAAIIFLCGFALNLFCTLYTAYRMAGFRQGIEETKRRIYTELKGEQKNE